MKKIILATNNLNKLKELKSVFNSDVQLQTLKEVGFNKEIIEDGSTFIENSMIKCREVYDEFKMPIIADDSGLCVEALNGDPGVLSARFGGKNLSDIERCKLLLSKLEGKTNLNASFVCALILYINPNRVFIVQEEFKGEIIFSIRGNNGFGYDPIFFLEQFGKTVAELPENEKNLISHRGKAANIMKKILSLIDFQ